MTEYTIDDAEEAFADGQLEDALVICECVVEVDPTHAGALAMMGECLLDLQEFEGAAEVFADLLGLDESMPSAWNGLGVALFELSDFDGARRALETAIDLDPRIAESRMVLGYLHERRGAQVDARNCFERAVELAPDHFHLPTDISAQELRTTVREVIRALPGSLSRVLMAVDWIVEDLPSTTLLRSVHGPISPMTLCLFSGPPRDSQRTPEPLEHPPQALLLFRQNFAKTVFDERGLAEVVQYALLSEAEHFWALSREEVEALGLDGLLPNSPHCGACRAAETTDPLLEAFANEPIPPNRTLH